MLFRHLGVAAAIAVASATAVIATAGSASAAIAPTTAIQVTELRNGDSISGPAIGTSVGACNFLFSGPSTSPYYTPFRIEGQATAVTTALVTSVELGCTLRTWSGGYLGRLIRNTPGYASVVAGDINVSVAGPFQICTMVNVHYMNGDESNPNEYEVCQYMHGILG